jgi:cobaltochelatase CobS
MDQQETPQRVTKTAKEAFPGVLEANTPLAAFDRPWVTRTVRSPQVKQDYVWDVTKLKCMIAFFLGGGTAAKLIGQTGTGKTECFMQFHAALNLPAFFITANPRTEAHQLVGRYFPCPSGGVEWRDGPLLAAARWGCSILIDEYNTLDPGEATGLNAFLEGRPYTVEDTAETIVPAPGFRVFVSINPKSYGYSGRNEQDLANDDRFVDFLFEYPPPDVEKKQVVDFLQSLRQPAAEAGNIANVIVDAANMIRRAFMGESDSANALSFTMSRRGVMEWAKWTVLSRSLAPSGVNPLFYALDLVLGNRQDRTGREALRHIVEGATGQTAAAAAAP